MSGPKGIGYTVVSAEELRRRAVEAGRASVQARRAMLAELVARAGAFPAALRRVRELAESAPTEESDEPAELTRRAERLSVRIAEAHEVLAQARAEAGRAAVRDAVAGIALHFDDWSPVAPTPHDRTVPDEAIQGQLARTVAVVAENPELGSEAVTGIGDVQRLLRSGQTARASALLASLRLRLGELIEAAEQRGALQTAIEDALRAHDDQTGASAEALRQELRHATSLAQVRLLAERLAACRAEAKATADRTYVFAQVVDVLRELGYNVETQSLPIDASPVLAVRESMPGHGLQLRFRADDPSFYTNVVAFAESSPLQDTAVEHQTCADLDAATHKLEDRGVRAVFRHRRPAGVVPIERKAPADVQRGRPSNKQRERAL